MLSTTMKRPRSVKRLVASVRRGLSAKLGRAATRSDLATTLGVSPNSVANWENGASKPSDANVDRMVQILEEFERAEPSPQARDEATGEAPGRVREALVPSTTGEAETRRVSAAEPAPLFALGIPEWTRRPLPEEAEASLRKIIADLRLECLSKAVGTLVDPKTNRVVWLMVVKIPVDAMEYIIRHRNEGNRVVGANRSAQYADEMRSGNWLFTGETLLFTDKGDLLNGQNRLLAAIATRTPLATAVCIGVDPKVYSVIDGGLGRTAKQRCQQGKHAYANVRSMTIALIHRFEKSGEDADYLEHQMPQSLAGSKLDELNEHYADELEPALDFIHGLRWSIGNKALPRHIATFVFIHLARASADAARHFIRRVADGGEIPGSPIVALRDKLAKMAQAPAKGATEARHRSVEIMRLLVKAWNSYCSGRQNTSGQFQDHEKRGTYELIAKHVAKPCPRILADAVQGTDQAVIAAILEKARSIRENEMSENVAKTTDRDGTKVKYIRSKLGIE